MVSLSLMARLVEAVRPDARLVLVGDPGQLTSIEAGAVLGDIVGPGRPTGCACGPRRGARLAQATGRDVAAGEPPPRRRASATASSCSTASTASAAGSPRSPRRSGAATPTRCSRCSRAAPEGVTWIPVDVADAPARDALAPVREGAVAAARAVIEAAPRRATRGDAIAALGAFRVLCAHRRGAHGVATWTARIEGWLADEIDGFGADGRWYVGPAAARDRERLRAAALQRRHRRRRRDRRRAAWRAAFERRGEVLEFSPTRLGAVDTVYAMTVHKSQGSQFDTAAVLLPAPDLARSSPASCSTRRSRARASS